MRPYGLKEEPRSLSLCNESGSSQLWEMNPDGTDRKRLSDYDKDIEGFAFSPDEKEGLVYLASENRE